VGVHEGRTHKHIVEEEMELVEVGSDTDVRGVFGRIFLQIIN
jgi:hypothetical protein